MKYFTKIFSMFGDTFAKSGDMLNNPMLMMALMSGDDSSDMSQMLMMSAMSKGQGNPSQEMNPMMMAMMMSGNGKSDKSGMSTMAMMSLLGGGANLFGAAPVAAPVKAAPKAPVTK